jgi:hypothetical protein
MSNELRDNLLGKTSRMVRISLSVVVFELFSLLLMSTTVRASGTWNYTGNLLQDPRFSLHATTLQDGRVLIEGGNAAGHISADSEIYDPLSDTWTLTGSTFFQHSEHTSTLLQDGKVLVSGGVGGNRFLSETYDPLSGTWTRTGEMVNSHSNHTATRLPDGRVLIAGGIDLRQTDIYNPATRTYSFGGNMTTGRSNHVAVLLNDGKVLLAGGKFLGNIQTSAEIYDPVRGTFTAIAPMNIPRSGAGTALLNDGRVLVVGGGTTDSSITAEAYDHTLGTWTLTGSMSTGRTFLGGLKLVSLSDGTVMAVGSDPAGTSEIYNPSTGLWNTPINLKQPQCHGATAPLSDGKVLLAGGTDCTSLDNKVLTAQLYSATDQLTVLSPARVWIGLKNSDDVGTRFDLKAETYVNGDLVSSGELNNVWGGSSGFNNAHLQTIPFNSFTPVDFPQGSTLNTKLYVRNACQGPTHNSGTARLWYDDVAANSRFDATIGENSNDYYLRNNFLLSTQVGTGPKQKIDIQAGSPCSPFKIFGTWSLTQ